MVRKEQILVVDDEVLTLRLVQKVLKKHNLDVSTAANAEEALEIIKNKNFNLLLTDVRMPGLNGIELLHQFKQHSPGAAAVIFSGHGNLDMALDAINKGSDGFLMKPFTTDELINTVNSALDRVRLLRENIRLKSIVPLFEVSKKLVTKLKTDELLDYLVSVAGDETGSDSVSIMLKKDEKSLEISAVRGIGEHYKGKTFKIGEGFAGMVAQNGKPLLLNDADKDENLNVSMKRDNISSAIIIPIQIDHDIKGVINVTKLKGNSPAFTEGDADFMTILAGQAAVALENVKLVEGLNDLFISTIRVLSNTIDMKSKWTSGHSDRVTQFALKLASELNLENGQIKNLELACLLHDIGKIGTFEYVLDKPGKLTAKEFEMVKNHSVAGFELLIPIKQLKGITKIIRHHHERFDGDGYPDGLKGTNIPFLSRIIAVADSYDAMKSDRPYKHGKDIKFIMKELKQCSGSQFDPEVVSACIKILEKEK
ncbi:MAG: HD domain-containing phosphohydrolase [Leptospirales bacterium]